MKFKITTALLLTVLAAQAQKVDVSTSFKDAALQTVILINNVDAARKEKPNLVSPRTVENGKLKMVVSRDWTSGFFPGELWYFYEYYKGSNWLELAKKYTEDIKKEQFKFD